MDVWRITLAALRRWYVLVPLLALTGVLVVLAGGRVAPEYEAQASAMLMPERAAPEIANPYGDIAGANAALAIVLNSVETRQAVQAQGLSPNYEIGAAPRTAILQVAIRADSPEVAEQTGLAVIAQAEQELATRQTEAGLPAAAQYSVAVLEAPAVTAVVNTGKARVQAVVGVLGAGLSVLVAVLFDDIVGLWRRARERRRSPGRRSSRDDAEPLDGTPPKNDPPDGSEPDAALNDVPPQSTAPLIRRPVPDRRRRPRWAAPSTSSSPKPESDRVRTEPLPARTEPMRSRPNGQGVTGKPMTDAKPPSVARRGSESDSDSDSDGSAEASPPRSSGAVRRT